MKHEEPYHSLKFISNTGGKPVEKPKLVFAKPIDYEAEVKKVYPAAVRKKIRNYGYAIFETINAEKYFAFSTKFRLAWQSAYNTITNNKTK